MLAAGAAIVALILFGADAFGVSSRVNLQSLGLMALAAALLFHISVV